MTSKSATLTVQKWGASHLCQLGLSPDSDMLSEISQPPNGVKWAVEVVLCRRTDFWVESWLASLASAF